MSLHEKTINDYAPVDLKSDLEQNWGLPLSFYRGEDALNLDLRSIFRKSWQYFCPAVKVAEPGNSTIGHVGDIPVVVIRDDEGVLHGFVNMCRHRGFPVATKDQKNCNRLVCRYHAWSYHQNGAFMYAPGCQDEKDFPEEKLGLKPVQVFEWGPGIFVNYDMDAPSFLDSHPEIAGERNKVGMDFSEDSYTWTHSTNHSVESNWKVWYDNFVECYHCENIHRGSFAAAYEADPKLVNTRFLGTFMSSQFPPKDRKSKTELRAGNYRSFNIFPGLLMLQHDDLMILSQMRPLGPETTEQRVDYFAQKGTSPERVQQWIELWEETFAEDGEAVSMQQKGLRTHALERNRLLPDREEAVLFFNSLIVNAYVAHSG
ncbi:aromatic ring-hydroxylating oxygenase subunit alpha [Leisingera sp. S232]|uniref:aromatic ring-hydroxylating oxygenase subunit alpha n=1 Tax=Leisingera sp. S232 TaxID=3415132 RepID=UPI00086E4A56|nr:hypothetical protein AB838_08505 [Rhodobacteraceae bacterium (ex Bugula neritina AB1)]